MAGAMIAFGKLMIRPEFSGEQSLRHGRIGPNAHPFFHAVGRLLLLKISPEEGVGRLKTLYRSVLGGLLHLFAVEVGGRQWRGFYLAP